MESLIEQISQLIKRDPKMTFKSRYVNRFGQFVPRVTEILSFDGLATESLMRWSNSLGFKRINYTDARNEAANIGTKGHNAIEDFLKDGSIDYSNMVVRGFLKWYNGVIENHIFKVLSMEESLVCDWFGGTYDLLCEIDGRVFLVDFKTSNHITYKYFMQLAAYIYMLNLNNIKVDGAIVLQLSKVNPEYNEFMLDFARPQDLAYMNQCTYAFFSLVNAYYAVIKASMEFNIFF